jgi:hypothetical protein
MSIYCINCCNNLISVPNTTSYIRGWMQMVATPNDLFSWNNKYSKYTVTLLHYIHQWRVHSSLSSNARQLTLCMLASWSCEGVVFLVHPSSSHFTAGHVFSLPLSGVNWRSLPLLWGSGPPFPKMAALSTGSAHTPFLGSNTISCKLLKKDYRIKWMKVLSQWLIACFFGFTGEWLSIRHP